MLAVKEAAFDDKQEVQQGCELARVHMYKGEVVRCLCRWRLSKRVRCIGEVPRPVWDVHIHAYDADDGLSEKHGHTHITHGRHKSAH